jgi:type I restriction enzyme R subunit
MMPPVSPTPSPNFAYLAHHDPRLVAVATQAEVLFPIDPSACLAKLRLLAEILAKRAAAKLGMFDDPTVTQQALIDRLLERNAIGATKRSLFHDLRRAGNVASHQG